MVRREGGLFYTGTVKLPFPVFIQKDRRIPPSVHIVIGHHRVHTEIFDRTEFSPRHLHGEKFVDTHTLCMGSSGKHPPSSCGALFP